MPFVLLAVLMLGIGLAIGVGLSEAPMVLGGPLPPNPTSVTASSIGGTEPLVAVRGQAADALAAAIDAAPEIQGQYFCPPRHPIGKGVTLAFRYSETSAAAPIQARFVVSVEISFTVCRGISFGPMSLRPRRLTSDVLSNLRPLGTPPAAGRAP